VPTFSGVSHFDLTVSDADRSAEWYERVLCMVRLGEMTDLATPGLEARVVQMLNPGRLTIGLTQHAAGERGEFSEFRIGLDHVALGVESLDALAEWVQHLDRCGVAHSEVYTMPYGSLVAFRDPDNIQLELFVLAPDFRLDLD
jgi:catechol 2,3-dioxygenase-like lactoylglutathione lyase family enzyme